MKLLILIPIALLLISLSMDEVNSALKKKTRPPKSKLRIKIKRKVKDCTQRTQTGDKVDMHYVGRFAGKGGKEFDNSHTKGEPFTFTLGGGEVIKAFDLGLLKMCVGEKRKLIVPSRFAYGKKGMPPAIPPRSTLVFTVELMKIHQSAEKTKPEVITDKKAEL